MFKVVVLDEIIWSFLHVQCELIYALTITFHSLLRPSTAIKLTHHIGYVHAAKELHSRAEY